MTFSILQSNWASSILIACFFSVLPSFSLAQDSGQSVPVVHGIENSGFDGIQLVTAVDPAPNVVIQTRDELDRMKQTGQGGASVNSVDEHSIDWQPTLSIGDQLQGSGTDWPSNPASAEESLLEIGEFPAYQFQLASPFQRYRFYRSEESIFSWLPATGDNLGWLSIESGPYLATPAEESNEARQGLTSAINIHWLNGPNDIDLPARVYDFVLGFQKQQSLGARFSYDVAGSIGVYSDFEDSAREGVRFVSHAVGMMHLSDRFDFVFGVDYLDRNDLAILPVIGFSFRPVRAPSLKIDAIFPRPEIAWAADDSYQLYVRGLMGGGSWDIEFPDESNDVVTYRDYQILFGIKQHKDDEVKRWEIGYVFQRQMEFASRADQREFDDAFIIRFVTLK